MSILKLSITKSLKPTSSVVSVLPPQNFCSGQKHTLLASALELVCQSLIQRFLWALLWLLLKASWVWWGTGFSVSALAAAHLQEAAQHTPAVRWTSSTAVWAFQDIQAAG